MAIGSITVAQQAAGQGPIFHDLISFLGDGAYPTGGTAAFQASVRAAVGADREVLYIVPEDCGGYGPLYDKSADKLKVYEEGADGGPADEVANTTDLSSITFNVWVISK